MLIENAKTITVTEKQIMDVLSSKEIPKDIRDKIIRRLNFYNYLNQSGENPEMSKWIEEFDLSPAIINSLRRNHIYTEKQLKELVINKGVGTLLRFRNIGEKRFEEMKIAFPWLANY